VFDESPGALPDAGSPVAVSHKSVESLRLCLFELPRLSVPDSLSPSELPPDPIRMSSVACIQFVLTATLYCIQVDQRYTDWNCHKLKPNRRNENNENNAGEKNAVDPEVRQEIEALLMKYDEAFNKNDAAAVAALFTPVAVEVFGWESGGGAALGQQAIEKRYAVELEGV